jgi:hypothetical protein
VRLEGRQDRQHSRRAPCRKKKGRRKREEKGDIQVFYGSIFDSRENRPIENLNVPFFFPFSSLSRMEDYARYWVSRGVQIQAEIYPLSATGQSLRCAEMVLRRQVRDDGWALASDGSSDEIRPQGFGGWNSGVVS